MLNGAGWLVTIGAIGGSVAGFGGASLLFRFLNDKINKIDESKDNKIEKLNGEKQNIIMCNERFNHLSNSLARVESKLDISVVAARDNLNSLATKLDQGTEIQNSIQKEISLMIQTVKKYNHKNDI